MKRRYILGTAVLGIAIGVSCGEASDPGGSLDRFLAQGQRDAIPVAVLDTYDAMLDACRRREGSALWVLMGSRLKGEVDAQARQAATDVGPAGLRREFGYVGHPAGFDGTAYLQGLMVTGGERSPCPDADLWRRVDAQTEGEHYVFVAERPDGQRQAIRFAEGDGGFVVADISKPRRL